MTAALRKHLKGLQDWQRAELWRNSYNEAGILAGSFGVDPQCVRRLCADLDRQETSTGFALLKAWHDAILVDKRLSATEKVAALRVWSFVNHGHLYAWPSQDRLAAELGYSRGPNLGKALRRSFEIGAYSQVKVKNLPHEVRDQAVNLSRRSKNGTAYRLNPVAKWEDEAAAFAELQNGNMFHGGTLIGSMAHHHNREGNLSPAAPDSLSFGEGDSSLPFPQVETSHYGNDPSETDRYGSAGGTYG